MKSPTPLNLREHERTKCSLRIVGPSLADICRELGFLRSLFLWFQCGAAGLREFKARSRGALVNGHSKLRRNAIRRKEGDAMI